MKTKKKMLVNQRKILEKKIEAWIPLRSNRVPPSGWLKAIRGALGINASQMAKFLGVTHSAIRQFEKNETQHKISLETIEKVAHAMHCKLVYAIVPQEPYSNFEAIIDERATQAARSVVSKVDHTMKLEQQGISRDRLNEQIREIARELKDNMDSTLWESAKDLSRQRKLK